MLLYALQVYYESIMDKKGFFGHNVRVYNVRMIADRHKFIQILRIYFIPFLPVNTLYSQQQQQTCDANVL